MLQLLNVLNVILSLCTDIILDIKLKDIIIESLQKTASYSWLQSSRVELIQSHVLCLSLSRQVGLCLRPVRTRTEPEQTGHSEEQRQAQTAHRQLPV